MTNSPFWSRFPQIRESQGQTNPADYWSQFPKVEETAAKGIEAQPTNAEPTLNQDQDQGQVSAQDSSVLDQVLDKAKRLGGIAAHGFSQGVGGLADIVALAEHIWTLRCNK